MKLNQNIKTFVDIGMSNLLRTFHEHEQMIKDRLKNVSKKGNIFYKYNCIALQSTLA